jgi:Sec-independent protein translocase protein TatA
MFGIGFSEIVIVFLALIVLVRPDDLPKFLRTAGRLYGRAKKAYNELIAVKDRIIREIDEAVPAEPPAKPPES